MKEEKQPQSRSVFRYIFFFYSPPMQQAPSTIENDCKRNAELPKCSYPCSEFPVGVSNYLLRCRREQEKGTIKVLWQDYNQPSSYQFYDCYYLIYKGMITLYSRPIGWYIWEPSANWKLYPRSSLMPRWVDKFLNGNLPSPKAWIQNINIKMT